ncbi:MAG: TraR/DksA C4-type zinc finger protein [Immundisolibacteraceae bacterium]|nr:TraR/DksA C4-type zinc finger protein [Immundisolibacteraceae bacterium]
MEKYQRLLDERAAMLHQQRQRLAPTRAVFTVASKPQAEQPKEALVRQLFAEDQVQQIFLQLDQVRDAQARIAEGTYGVCQQCREEISPGRLQLLPETPVCLGCQESAEAG